ncbi:MAG: geranylgeranylglyceryl/heptaprenylglyceryl phosphate synthase [bacterium]|nr:geranylgeranylglyceryl/heptaprenylglyceryl phosphate synthase [bacterium]
MSLYERLFHNGEKKKVLVLLDPDKLNDEKVFKILSLYENQEKVLGFLVGSSLLVRSDMEDFISRLKSNTSKPVIIFPGSHCQVVKGADAILFLSLLSGRNPQYLIDEQVKMAPLVKRYGLEAIPTAYLLFDSGKTTTVEFVSGTRPLPRDKVDLAVAHALAAEYLGFKLLYLEAGSGALNPVPGEVIRNIKDSVNIPLIVGGGLNTEEKILRAFENGADFVVIGNKLEEDPEFLRRLYG